MAQPPATHHGTSRFIKSPDKAVGESASHSVDGSGSSAMSEQAQARRHAQPAGRTLSWAARRGLGLLPGRRARAPTLGGMKLVVAIVHHDDAGAIVEALLEREYRATRLDSSGGFLRKSNATLLIGVDASAVADVLAVIRAHGRPRSEVVQRASAPATRKVDLGAGVVFVIDVEDVVRL
jgi:uncharacterized protein YaaQ